MAMIRTRTVMLKLCLAIVTYVVCTRVDACSHHAPPTKELTHPTAPGPSGESHDPFADPGIFSVADYGAVQDGKANSTSGFLAAWKLACSFPGNNATFYVPPGTYNIDPVTFAGPCHDKRSPKVVIRGTLKAPASLDAFQDSNWIVFEDLIGLDLAGEPGNAVFDGQGVSAWEKTECLESKCSSLPISLRIENVSHGNIHNIALMNSKGFHMNIYASDSIIVSNVNITAPENSPNTDGIHVSLSSNITITSSIIGVGDDCVSIGGGCTNISVSNVKCGPGHGISVGSLGKYQNEKNVDSINVSNCIINSTQNGIRIKTWPGSPPSNASNITFENISMINVSNPIIVDQDYCPSNTCDNHEPSGVKLSDMYFKNISGSYSTHFAITMVCSSRVPCQNVMLSGIKLNRTTNENSREGRVNMKGSFNGFEIFDSSF